MPAKRGSIDGYVYDSNILISLRLANSEAKLTITNENIGYVNRGFNKVNKFKVDSTIIANYISELKDFLPKKAKRGYEHHNTITLYDNGEQFIIPFYKTPNEIKSTVDGLTELIEKNDSYSSFVTSNLKKEFKSLRQD